MQLLKDLAKFIKNKPTKLLNLLLKILNEMYTNPNTRKQIYKDIATSTQNMKLNGGLVIILDTCNEIIIRKYFNSHSLPANVINKIKKFQSRQRGINH